MKKGLEFHPPPEPLVTLCIMEWEDDFQPLKSNKGQKKGTSSWIKTVTIVPPFGMKDSSICNTYPVAIGPKGINHEAVERKFKEELLLLSNGSNDLYFDKSTGRMTYVHVELFAALADQPERRGGTYLQLGNSNYHPCFGYCCDILSVQNVLQACKECFHSLLSIPMGGQINIPSCPNCCCWKTTGHDLLTFPAPKGYPSNHDSNSTDIVPYRLTFQSLIAAVEKAHLNVSNGTWKPESGRSYLRVHCLSGTAIEGILEHAKNVLTYTVLERNQDSNAAAFGAICRERSLYPEQFQMWAIPSWWTRGTSVTQHIEASMHLLSGVIKALTRCIQQWTANHGNKVFLHAICIFVIGSYSRVAASLVQNTLVHSR